MRQINIPRIMDSFKVNFLFIILYRIFLDLVYFCIILPKWGYAGFRGHFDIFVYGISWITLLVMFPMFHILNSTLFEPSKLVIFILVFLEFVPFTTMIAFSSFSVQYSIANGIYWLLLIGLNILPLKKIKNSILFSKKIKKIVIFCIAIMTSCAVVFVFAKYTDFSFKLDIRIAYNLRYMSREFSVPTLLKYILAAANIINPILIMYFLCSKKYFTSLLFVVIQICNYSIFGLKSTLLMLPLIFIVYLFYKEEYKYKLPIFFAIIPATALLEFFLHNTYILVDYFIRRMQFLTNKLNFEYFDFFSKNTPDYFRQSFLRHLGFQSPYESIQFLIGRLYYNKPTMDANSGLISDAITNFGIPGIIIMPIILTIILKLLDLVTQGLQEKIYITSCILVTYLLVSSFLGTILLTHGLVLMILLLYFLPRGPETHKKGQHEV